MQKIISVDCKQKGSKINDKYFTYDFNFFRNITQEEILSIEKFINIIINQQIDVKTYTISKDLNQMRKQNIYFQFIDKYNENVRVIDIINVCKELCEGTHVNNTKNIIFFKIINTKNISNNIKRITAITQNSFIKNTNLNYSIINQLTKILNCNSENIITKTINIIKKYKKIQKKYKQQMFISYIKNKK